MRYDHDTDKLQVASNPIQWNSPKSGLFTPSNVVVQALPAGIYDCWMEYGGQVFIEKSDIKSDDIVEFHDGPFEDVVSDVNSFWKQRENYKAMGFLHKLGIMLYGPPGSGKSCMIHQICNNLVKDGHVVFIANNPNELIATVKEFRKIESTRPLMCVMEDFENIVANYGEGPLLQWLDGTDCVDSVVTLASTNYPEKLNRRMIARPRRFDKIVKIEQPSDNYRMAYFKKKMPTMPEAELNLWTRLSKGLSFASLADMVISVKCRNHDLEDTVALLRKIESGNPSSQEFIPTEGFDEDEDED